MQRRALLGGIAVGSVAALSGCSATLFGGRVEETRKQEFDPADDAAVNVQNQNGDISVDIHDGERMVVDASVSAPSEERLGDVAIASDASDGEFTVEVLVDGDTSGVRADLDIRAPEGTAMASVQSENGEVSVREVLSVSAARSRNGDVRVRNAGPVGSVSTENGDVEADVPAPLPGDVTVRSTNGDVDAWLSPDVDAALRVTTENGGVDVRDLDLADRQESESAVQGVLGEGANEVTVSSENGTVTVGSLD